MASLCLAWSYRARRSSQAVAFGPQDAEGAPVRGMLGKVGLCLPTNTSILPLSTLPPPNHRDLHKIYCEKLQTIFFQQNTTFFEEAIHAFCLLI